MGKIHGGEPKAFSTRRYFRESGAGVSLKGMVCVQESARQELRETGEKLILAQAERDAKAVRVEELLAAQGLPTEQQTGGTEAVGVMQKHLQRISDLQAEVKRLRKVYLSFASHK